MVFFISKQRIGPISALLFQTLMIILLDSP
jgi:hypothetical protein